METTHGDQVLTEVGVTLMVLSSRFSYSLFMITGGNSLDFKVAVDQEYEIKPFHKQREPEEDKRNQSKTRKENNKNDVDLNPKALPFKRLREPSFIINSTSSSSCFTQNLVHSFW